MNESETRYERRDRVKGEAVWVMLGVGLAVGCLAGWLLYAIRYRYPLVADLLMYAGWMPVFFVAYLAGHFYAERRMGPYVLPNGLLPS